MENPRMVKGVSLALWVFLCLFSATAQPAKMSVLVLLDDDVEITSSFKSVDSYNMKSQRGALIVAAVAHSKRKARNREQSQRLADHLAENNQDYARSLSDALSTYFPGGDQTFYFDSVVDNLSGHRYLTKKNKLNNQALLSDGYDVLVTISEVIRLNNHPLHPQNIQSKYKYKVKVYSAVGGRKAFSSKITLLDDMEISLQRYAEDVSVFLEVRTRNVTELSRRLFNRLSEAGVLYNMDIDYSLGGIFPNLIQARKQAVSVYTLSLPDVETLRVRKAGSIGRRAYPPKFSNHLDIHSEVIVDFWRPGEKASYQPDADEIRDYIVNRLGEDWEEMASFSVVLSPEDYDHFFLEDSNSEHRKLLFFKLEGEFVLLHTVNVWRNDGLFLKRYLGDVQSYIEQLSFNKKGV